MKGWKPLQMKSRSSFSACIPAAVVPSQAIVIACGGGKSTYGNGCPSAICFTWVSGPSFAQRARLLSDGTGEVRQVAGGADRPPTRRPDCNVAARCSKCAPGAARWPMPLGSIVRRAPAAAEPVCRASGGGLGVVPLRKTVLSSAQHSRRTVCKAAPVASACASAHLHAQPPPSFALLLVFAKRKTSCHELTMASSLWPLAPRLPMLTSCSCRVTKTATKIWWRPRSRSWMRSKSSVSIPDTI